MGVSDFELLRFHEWFSATQPKPASSVTHIARHLDTLDDSINKVEAEHDTLNLEFAKGEISGYNAVYLAQQCSESSQYVCN